MAIHKKLREAIQAVIQTAAGATVPVYYYFAKDPESAPYIVWSMQDLDTLDGKTSAQVEINVVDLGDSTGTVEDLTDAIEAAFDHAQYLTADFLLTTYKGSRTPVSEEDVRVMRRRLVVDAYFYER